MLINDVIRGIKNFSSILLNTKTNAYPEKRVTSLIDDPTHKLSQNPFLVTKCDVINGQSLTSSSGRNPQRHVASQFR